LGGGKMAKKYVIWWHNYIEEIDRNATTIKDVSDSVSKTLKELNKLKKLEEEGKIKVRHKGTLNPLFIDILDPSIESEIANNPIVDME
jgi:predicted PilT family ATPase